MKAYIILLLLPLLTACGSNNFAKRKYTKGVYVEKRATASSKKSKDKNALSSLPKGQKHLVNTDNLGKSDPKESNNTTEEEKEINKEEIIIQDVNEYSEEKKDSESSNTIENPVSEPEQTNNKVDLDNRPSNVFYWVQLSMYFGIGASSFSLISYIIGLIVAAITATGVGGIVVSIIGILAGITGFVLSTIALTKAKYMTKMEKFKASLGLFLSIFAIVASIFALLGFISSTW